ncbi:hypothetical protein EPA93_39645 [Ktedonosporobacter rubrisoli]|uniref:Uncharacterized protein n=1 Tax=Ktedonosporobacter rubrisoli TaxID=2509675 RepID=A0A4P6K126_KTERU|nr:hypothetical protein EPA93_39645 [Ktedonosporobacter rubrisoli]
MLATLTRNTATYFRQARNRRCKPLRCGRSSNASIVYSSTPMARLSCVTSCPS